VKYALDFLLASVVALCVGMLVYGFVLYPDAPIHPCGVNQFCGKRDQLRTEEQYRKFVAWEQALLISVPFGFLAGFILERRSRRRASLAWDRLRALQTDQLPIVEEQRYEMAWKDLHRRVVTARVLFLPALLWIGWALFRGSIPEGGLFGPLPLALFALAAGSNLWYLFYRCPRCGNRYFMILTTAWAYSERCIHCDLLRETTFGQALTELKESRRPSA